MAFWFCTSATEVLIMLIRQQQMYIRTVWAVIWVSVYTSFGINTFLFEFTCNCVHSSDANNTGLFSRAREKQIKVKWESHPQKVHLWPATGLEIDLYRLFCKIWGGIKHWGQIIRENHKVKWLSFLKNNKQGSPILTQFPRRPSFCRTVVTFSV